MIEDSRYLLLAYITYPCGAGFWTDLYCGHPWPTSQALELLLKLQASVRYIPFKLQPYVEAVT